MVLKFEIVLPRRRGLPPPASLQFSQTLAEIHVTTYKPYWGRLYFLDPLRNVEKEVFFLARIRARIHCITLSLAFQVFRGRAISRVICITLAPAILHDISFAALPSLLALSFCLFCLRNDAPRTTTAMAVTTKTCSKNCYSTWGGVSGWNWDVVYRATAQASTPKGNGK